MKTRTLYPLVSILLLAACAGPGPTPTAAPAATLPPPEVQSTIAPSAPQAPTPYPSEHSPSPEPEAEPIQTVPVEVIAEGLNLPWELAFLPDGQILLTERPGQLTLLEGQQRLAIEGVLHRGEGGLLGLALHPNFAENHWLYLYLTSEENGAVVNRVERYVYTDHSLSERTPIIEGIRGATYHDGGRIAFGPDGKLYITTGDAGMPAAAQVLENLDGKILRLNDDGSIPEDNPYGTAVWTYGHRNAQGLAWDNQGRLWATEHGPSGGESGNDEVNLIEAGKNYGWPQIRGLQTAEGMVTPVVESTRQETWAPSGMAFLGGKLWFAGLRGQTLYALPVDDLRPETLERHLAGEYGRLRTVVLGPDGLLYITTSNGNGANAVDRVLRVNPALLGED